MRLLILGLIVFLMSGCQFVVEPQSQSGTCAGTPSLTSLQPSSGPTTGGTVVTLSGQNLCPGLVVAFGNTTADNVTILSNTSVTATAPAHALGAVSVSVTNPGGASAVLSSAFTYVSPSALSLNITASPPSGIAPLAVAFSANVSGGVAPYGYVWSFGDGAVSSNPSPSHTYQSVGSYTASLTVMDSELSTITQSVSVTVTATTGASLAASISASVTSGTAPLAVAFTSTVSGGTAPYTYAWTFGDGSSSTTQNPSHTFSSAGTYTTSLKVTDGQQHSVTQTVSVTVTTAAPAPLAVSATSSITSGTAPLAVAFSSTVSGGTAPYTYAWAFGDGASSTVQNPSHTYSAAGSYSATLTVTDSKSNKASRSVSITVSSGTSACGGTTYPVGPGLAYTTLASVPWGSLKPGDTVAIHYNGTGGYHEKIYLTQSGTASCPIVISGVADASGNKPVIDGQNATTSAAAAPRYKPLEAPSLILAWPTSYGGLVSYVTIQGLEIRNASKNYTFTDENGVKTAYVDFTAAIYGLAVDHFTVTNCTIHDSGLGIFINSNGSYNSSNIEISYNHLYNNGVSGSYYEHAMYNEADNITYEYNLFGPMVSGSGGCQLKDRSAGTIIRYNYFAAPGGHILDLVDPEDEQSLASTPEFKNTYVYGNTMINSGDSPSGVLVHFGGDSGLGDYRTGNLEFYDNTVVSLEDQSSLWRLAMFNADGGGTIYASNNIFYNASATAGGNAPILEFLVDSGTIHFSATNWVSPGWLSSQALEPGTYLTNDTTVTGTSTLFVDPNNNPGFVSISGGNFHLAPGSSAIGKGGALGAGWPAVSYQYQAITSSAPRSSIADLGAFSAN